MNKVIIFDTTMRDGELVPGVKFNLQQKISISKLLEEIGIDVIEVGYPGNSFSDFEQVLQISKITSPPIKPCFISPLLVKERG